MTIENAKRLYDHFIELGRLEEAAEISKGRFEEEVKETKSKKNSKGE